MLLLQEFEVPAWLRTSKPSGSPPMTGHKEGQAQLAKTGSLKRVDSLKRSDSQIDRKSNTGSARSDLAPKIFVFLMHRTTISPVVLLDVQLASSKFVLCMGFSQNQARLQSQALPWLTAYTELVITACMLGRGDPQDDLQDLSVDVINT